MITQSFLELLMSYTVRIAAENVERFCKEILLQLGASPEDASIISAHLTDSDLRGIRSHGLLRMTRYVQQIDSGYIDLQAPILIEDAAQNLLRADAQRNFGILAFHRLLPLLIARTRLSGMAGGAVVNCAHTGRIGAYSEALAREYMWGCVFGGGGNKRLKEVAPFGGREGVFDTNPYALSMPIGEDEVASSDFATSATAQGKLLVYRTNKAPVPPGWIIDRQGRPSTNAEDFYDGGAMLPSAGAKGYGLGFMAELFGEAALGTPHELNWFITAVDLSRFADRTCYLTNATRFKREIENCPPAEGFDKVRWPGQPELEKLEEQSQRGISYSDDEVRSVAHLETRFSTKLLG